MLYFASSIITSVDKEAREEDADELRDELAADLEELDAERISASWRLRASCPWTTSPRTTTSSTTWTRTSA